MTKILVLYGRCRAKCVDSRVGLYNALVVVIRFPLPDYPPAEGI